MVLTCRQSIGFTLCSTSLMVVISSFSSINKAFSGRFSLLAICYFVKAETMKLLIPALLIREDLGRIYAAEIVSAVSHLHANGIMHRDLKPENILVDVDGHVYSPLPSFCLCVCARECLHTSNFFFFACKGYAFNFLDPLTCCRPC